MASTTPVKVILGAGQIGDKSGKSLIDPNKDPGSTPLLCERSSDALSDPFAKYNTPEEAQAFLNIFRKYGYTDIDTARGYSPHAPGTCESLIGQTNFTEWSVLDTKVPGGPGDGKAEKVAASIDASLAALKVSNVTPSRPPKWQRAG